MAQKTVKPKIEAVIGDVLKGEEKKNALDFVAYLRANKLNPSWASANSWKVSCKGKGVCYIRLHGTAHYHNLGENSWHICFINFGYTGLIGESDGQIVSDEKLKEIVWDNVKFCSRCSNCKRGNVVVVLGKRFEEVCHSWLVMENPAAETLNCAKTIASMRRRAILEII